MTTFLNEEYQQRIKGIERGPWSEGLIKARRELAPIDDLKLSVSDKSDILLDEISLSASNRRRDHRLSQILRSHFEDDDGITSPKEIELRDAFDYSLMIPQLYELAVQTGYLPIDAAWEPARRILTELLWSPSARTYVATYDYFAVQMLAARVGIRGVGAEKPPEPYKDYEMIFAGFLAHLRAFYSDELIQIWVSFLDDYIEEPDEQNKLWKYLHGQQNRAPERVTKLLAGCQLFVTSLSSIFDDPYTRAFDTSPFVFIHAYWLQKFFGYERIADGSYVKDTDSWDLHDSWACTLMTSPLLFQNAACEEIAEAYQIQFKERVQLLEHVFSFIRESASRLAYFKTSEKDLDTENMPA